MKLTVAANKFNNTPAEDAYNPAVTLILQYDPLAYAKIDGVAVRKRSVSADPSVTMPGRGAIRIDGEVYLIGHGAPDYWKGKAIRRNYVIQGADDLADLQSIAGKLAGTTPVQAYAAVIFNKYMPDGVDSSKYPPQYQLFVAGSENVPADSLATVGGNTYLIKQSYLSESGLRIALANEIDQPCFETIAYSTNTYDPITDSTSGTTKNVPIMRIKWTEHFNYLSAASTTFERGDMQVFALKTDLPDVKASDTLTLSDGPWRVISRQDEALAWSIHVRRG